MNYCDCAPMRAPGGLGLTEAGVELLNIPEGGSVIDIGCGEGETLRFLAQAGFSPVGIDLDPALAGDGVVTADAAALPFPDGSLDAALFECSFSKIEKAEAAVRECRRVLKSGARILVTDLYARGEPDTLAGFLGRVERYADVQRRFETLGFRQIHFEDQSQALMSLWSSLIFEHGAEDLKDEIGATSEDLKRIKCGYFLAVFEKPNTCPVDSWISSLTDAGDAEELRNWQLGKIREQLDHAKAGRFYAARLRNILPEDIRDFTDFEKLPFTTADDFAGNENDFLCVRPGHVSRIVTQPSSGTTGLPKRMSFTEADVMRTEEFFVPGLAELAQGGERATVYMSNDAPDSIGDLLRRALTRLGSETVIHGNITDFGEAADHGHGSALFVGFPHEMRALAEFAPNLRPNFVLLSADFIPESVVAALERIWGCRVIRHFGMTETCFGGAVDCALGGGQHIRHADFYFEIIDPVTCSPLPDDEFGELVITTLRSEAMPLIRYRTGDITRIESGICACGGVFPRLGYVRGRAALLKNRLNIHALDEFLFAREQLSGYTAEFDGETLTLNISGEAPSPGEITERFGVRAVIGALPKRASKPGAKRRIGGGGSV